MKNNTYLRMLALMMTVFSSGPIAVAMEHAQPENRGGAGSIEDQNPEEQFLLNASAVVQSMPEFKLAKKNYKNALKEKEKANKNLEDFRKNVKTKVDNTKIENQKMINDLKTLSSQLQDRSDVFFKHLEVASDLSAKGYRNIDDEKKLDEALREKGLPDYATIQKEYLEAKDKLKALSTSIQGAMDVLKNLDELGDINAVQESILESNLLEADATVKGYEEELKKITNNH